MELLFKQTDYYSTSTIINSWATFKNLVGYGGFGMFKKLLDLCNEYNIINSSKKLYERYDLLKGLSATFFINELLQNVNENDYVHVLTYRKFTSQKKFSHNVYA